jgi:hypothetical protein
MCVLHIQKARVHISIYCHPHILPRVKSYLLILVKYCFCCVSVSLGFISDVFSHPLYFLRYSCILRDLAFIRSYLAFICFLFTLFVLRKRTLSLTRYHFSSVLFCGSDSLYATDHQQLRSHSIRSKYSFHSSMFVLE